MLTLFGSLRVRVFTIFFVACALTLAQSASATLSVGADTYMFDDWKGAPLQVHTYRSADANPQTPIMIVMHGVKRDAARYRDEWIAVADELGLIIAAPEFDSKRFPKSANYSLGGLTRNNRGTSAFAAIEPLFDDIKTRYGSRPDKYYIYDHSAGSQFVHRYIFATPEARLEKAFAANPGWYTMLSAGVPFPYGLKDSGLPRSTRDVSLAAPLVILLGDADTKRGNNLRVTPEADAQSFNRLQRGMLFFSHAATLAGKRKMPFAWKLSIVSGAAHQNSKMAWGVAPHLMHRLAASNVHN